MKCDLHVHSYFSGLCTTPVFRRFCRESYSAPEAVYAALERRGMDLITLTDHDSIAGAESLRRHGNFFLSEELTCRMPSGTEVHIGVYDFHERQHAQLQRRRDDLPALLAYLQEQHLFFSINHVFSGLTGRREAEDFEWFRRHSPAIETRNGHMLPGANANAAKLARKWSKTEVGGSDAHALPSAGTTYTEVPRARNKDEFFAGLRAGMGCVQGSSGSVLKLTREILFIGCGMMKESPWTRLLAPLAALLPLSVLLSYYGELGFNRRWGAQILGSPDESGERHNPEPLLPEAALEECT